MNADDLFEYTKRMEDKIKKEQEEEREKRKEEIKNRPKMKGEIDPPENIEEEELNVRWTKVAPAMDWRKRLVLLVGSQETGKTHWLNHLFNDIAEQFDYGVVYCSSPDSAEDYDWIDGSNIWSEWNDFPEETTFIDPITSKRKKITLMKPGFYSTMMTILEKQGKTVKENGKENTPNIFMIIDDPMGRINFRTEPIFQVIAGQLRKFNITMLIVAQYLFYFAPWLRNNPHRIAFFQNTEDDLYKAKGMVMGWPTKKEWAEFITTMTRKFGGVLYDRATRTYWCFRAPPEKPKFRLKFYQRYGRLVKEKL